MIEKEERDEMNPINEPEYIPTAIDPATTAEYDQSWHVIHPDGRTELVSGDGKLLGEREADNE